MRGNLTASGGAAPANLAHLVSMAQTDGDAALRAMETQAGGLSAADAAARLIKFGPNAPKNLTAFLKALQETRKQGFSLTEETYTPGLNAMAAPVGLAAQLPMGTISVERSEEHTSELQSH